MRLTGGFEHEASRQVLSWEEKKKKKGFGAGKC